MIVFPSIIMDIQYDPTPVHDSKQLILPCCEHVFDFIGGFSYTCRIPQYSDEDISSNTCFIKKEPQSSVLQWNRVSAYINYDHNQAIFFNEKRLANEPFFYSPSCIANTTNKNAYQPLINTLNAAKDFIVYWWHVPGASANVYILADQPSAVALIDDKFESFYFYIIENFNNYSKIFQIVNKP